MSKNMYGVLGVWNLADGRWEEQVRGLLEQVVPLARDVPGFVAGYWLGNRDGPGRTASFCWRPRQRLRTSKTLSRAIPGTVSRPASASSPSPSPRLRPKRIPDHVRVLAANLSAAACRQPQLQPRGPTQLHAEGGAP